MKKRVFSAILTLCLLLTMMPTVAFAAEDDEAAQSNSVREGNCGAGDSASSVTWKLTQNNEDNENPTYTLTISGSGAMAGYTANINNTKAKQPWRTSETGIEIAKITNVVVSEGVTSIGAFAFNGLTAVSEYVIGADVSTISQWALDTSAAKVFKLNGNTNFQTDVDGVLFNKEGTTLIAYPGGSAVRDEYTVPSTVTAISDGAFVGCPIKKLTIGNNVKTVIPSWSFNGGVLEELDVNCPFDQSTFAQITTLKKVTLGGSITEIPERAFLNCKELQTVSIPSGLTKIGSQAFFGCFSLQNVTLPASLTEIGYQAFRDCDALTSITFPDSLEKVGNQAFLITKEKGHTGSLTTLTFGAKIPSFLTSDGTTSTNLQLFTGQDKLTTVDMSKCKNTTISAGLFNGLTSLETIIFPTGLTEIGDSAFTNCSGLKSLEFPDSLTKIGESAFSGCTGLTYISYGSGIDDIGRNAFGGCTGVKVIDMHRATKIGETYDNGKNGGDPALTHACIAAAHGVKYYLRTVDQASSVKGNLEWGNNVAGGGNTTNTYYILTATDAVPDYTGKTDTPTRAGYTFDQWEKVNVKEGSTTTENVCTDANSWYLASPTVTVSPASANTYVGGSAVTLTATVSEPVHGFNYSYQCYSNTSNSNEGGTKISKATSETYSPNITTAGTTYYYCVVTVAKDSNTISATTEVIPVSVTYKGSSHHSSSTSNTVSASTASNGKVTMDKSSAKKGDTVTITVTPDAGYELGKLTVTDAKGNTIATTKKDDNKYTFTMPDGKVTVTPTFTKIAEEKPSASNYVDVASSAWYADAVKYVADKGLMSGTGDKKFSPNASTTRGMLMTVLARYAGKDTAGSTPWYQAGMDWAKENGVSDGTKPTENITREQLVTMLYRSAGSPAASGSLDNFSDSASVGGYAVNAMKWAVANGIVNGSNGKLNPKNNATRAEVAAILMRFCEKTEK